MLEGLFGGKKERFTAQAEVEQTPAQTEAEAEAIIESVQEQVKGEQPPVIEEVPNVEKDKPLHTPKTVEQAVAEMKAVSNPNDFTVIEGQPDVGAEESLKDAA